MRAAERELYEELGLACRATALADPGAEPRPNPEEAAGYGWFDLTALPEDLAFPDHARD